jgi:hypothetical protein
VCTAVLCVLYESKKFEEKMRAKIWTHLSPLFLAFYVASHTSFKAEEKERD